MLTRMLQLLPIERVNLNSESNNLVNNRVFNLQKLEIINSDNQYLLNTDMGRIELEEGDEILIENLLLKANYKYLKLTPLSSEWNYDQEHPLEKHVLTQEQLEHEEKANYPLAFLFHNIKNEELVE